MNWRRLPSEGATEIYQAAALNQAGLVQGFSTKNWGNLALHTGDHAETVVKRRRQFLSSMGLRLEKLVAANQVHGAQVQVVEAGMAGAGATESATALPETDALITEVPGLVLAVFTADCLPIFLYDPDRPAVAVVHAGWRGTLDRIVARTVTKMVEQFQTRPERLWAALGPAICAQCFQVKPDLAELFIQADSQAVLTDANGYYIDLAGFNTRLLTSCGVAPEKITQCAPCTSCNRDTFFSYRAEGQTKGRMMGIITLK